MDDAAQWRYSTPVSGGYATLTIDAPGNAIDPDDAAYLVEWFDLINRRMRKFSKPEEAKQREIERLSATIEQASRRVAELSVSQISDSEGE